MEAVENIDAVLTEIEEEDPEGTGLGGSGSDDDEEFSEVAVTSEDQNQCQKSDEIEGSDSVKFSPPVYIQRYCKVLDVIERMLESPKYKMMNVTTGKTVMEVGCAEFGMMRYLKGLLDIGKILFVDLDQQLLLDKAHLLKPLPAEYLRRMARPQPLRVEAYAGCVTKVDAGLRETNPDVWAVIGIEIIEHLHPEVLRGFEETVFGITSPHIVIVTTPNADFNEVFNLPPGKFRHWDHKFEWTRAEFVQWCEKIIAEFPNYTYVIEGICDGPEETRHLGPVSQMAIFEKQELFVQDITRFASRLQGGVYSLIKSVEYPNWTETRSPEQIIVDEFQYHLNNYFFCSAMINEYEESGLKELKIPFKNIQSFPSLPPASLDDRFLTDVLVKAGFRVSCVGESLNVVIDVQEFISRNIDKISSCDDTERDLCKDLEELDVDLQPEPQSCDNEEECWE